MINRREALRAGAAGLTTSMLTKAAAGAAPAPEGKAYRVGLIGCGWYGKSDLFRLIQVAPVEVVAVCDVDQHMVKGAAEMVAKRQKSGAAPRTYSDYRELLKNEKLDLVLVGTPDHWHALPMIAACEAGLDVYVQKPISHDVMEGEAMVAAARKHGRVVQVGTQRKSTPHLVDAKKNVVDAGLLGAVGHVEVCCYYHMRANGNPPVETPPDFLDYEFWTGPAALRPYDGLPHKRWWRTFNEYGNGIMGDMCVHMLDTVRWMLGLKWPVRILSDGGIRVQKEGKSNIADTQVATFEYPGLDVVWQHRSWGTAPDPDYPWALFIHGEKGTLKASTWSYDFVPQDPKQGKAIRKECVFEREQYPEDVTEPDIELNAAPATRAHMKDFLAAVENRGRPIADVEEGHISTASCILANLAMKLGRAVVYDPAKRIVVGDDEATALLKLPYRAPWRHPADSILG